MLDDTAVKELQHILVEEHGQHLTLDEVRKLGTRLVHLYETVFTPGVDETKININHEPVYKNTSPVA